MFFARRYSSNIFNSYIWKKKKNSFFAWEKERKEISSTFFDFTHTLSLSISLSHTHTHTHIYIYIYIYIYNIMFFHCGIIRLYIKQIFQALTFYCSDIKKIKKKILLNEIAGNSFLMVSSFFPPRGIALAELASTSIMNALLRVNRTIRFHIWPGFFLLFLASFSLLLFYDSFFLPDARIKIIPFLRMCSEVVYEIRRSAVYGYHHLTVGRVPFTRSVLLFFVRARGCYSIPPMQK